jgi:hypothetical protein
MDDDVVLEAFERLAEVADGESLGHSVVTISALAPMKRWRQSPRLHVLCLKRTSPSGDTSVAPLKRIPEHEGDVSIPSRTWTHPPCA